MTSLILSNLDEYAVLVKFLRDLNSLDTVKEVAERALQLLGAYHLDGVIQLRLDRFELTLNPRGEVRQLESSILTHVKGMGSVVEYQKRAAFNYQRVSLLVNNMPTVDPDLCGRLRDHLAIATETIDARLLSIETRDKREAAKSNINEMFSKLVS